MQDYIQAYYHNWFTTNNLYEQFAKRFGIPSSLLFLVYELDQAPTTQRGLCEVLILPKQTVHSMLKKLEAQQHVSITPSKADKRERIVALTAKGIQHWAPILKHLEQIENQAMNGMSADEREAMRNTNRRFAECLEQALNDTKEHSDEKAVF